MVELGLGLNVLSFKLAQRPGRLLHPYILFFSSFFISFCRFLKGQQKFCKVETVSILLWFYFQIINALAFTKKTIEIHIQKRSHYNSVCQSLFLYYLRSLVEMPYNQKIIASKSWKFVNLRNMYIINHRSYESIIISRRPQEIDGYSLHLWFILNKY